jgi:hypothetical protein
MVYNYACGATTEAAALTNSEKSGWHLDAASLIVGRFDPDPTGSISLLI